MSLYRNPEFRRQAWLELTPQRLVATPLILGLVLLVGWLMESPVDLSGLSLTLFVAVTVLWGTKMASDSLNAEFAQGTWDSQRISGMGAWQMTVGKLLGGPVFAWYGGALCLGAFVWTAEWNWPSLRTLIGAIVAAVTFHAVALLLELVAWRKRPRAVTTPRARGIPTVLVLLMMGAQLFAALRRGKEMGETAWYGWTMPVADFALACGLLAMAWSVFGLYRAMRDELSYRDPPGAWIAFLLFLFAFSGGWFHGGSAVDVFPDLHRASAHLAMCLAMVLVASYVLLFSERKDWVRMRRLVAGWRDRDRRRAWQLTPLWLATFGVCCVVAIALGLTCLVTEPPMRGIAATSAGLAFIAFLVRDGAIVLGLNFTRDQGRADGAAALYLFVLYALLPGLLLAVGLPAFGALFWPPLVYEQPAWLAVIALETAAAIDFALRRWRRLPA